MRQKARPKFRCPVCGSTNVDMMVDITIVTSAQFENAITKKVLYSSRTELWGAYWEKASFFCRNPVCNHVMLAPNPKWVEEIKQLRKENAELKAQLSICD